MATAALKVTDPRMTADQHNPTRPVEAIILAAGKGTRMNGDRAKVLFSVADRPMIHWVLDACEAAGSRRQVVVIGHDAQQVRRELRDRDHVDFVEQTEQRGTGHAVQQADPLLDDRNVDLLVLCGDGPLIRGETLQRLLDAHRATGAAATLASSTLADPHGYGRIVRDDAGRFCRIVEESDADEAVRALGEINPSYYCFRAAALFDALAQVQSNNAKGEYYLTDVFAILLAAGERVEVLEAVAPQDVLSINTPADLAEVDAVLRRRLGMAVSQ